MSLKPLLNHMMQDGSAAEPGLPWASQPGSGLYKTSTGGLGVAVDGASVAEFNPESASVAGGLNVQKITVGYADLTDGVAALFGSAFPLGAIIKRTYYNVTETFAGDVDDASTISIGLEDQDNDVVAAVAISDGGAPWDEGLHEGIQDGTMANALVLTEARRLAVTVDIVADDTELTAGAMDVFVEWVQG